MDANECSQNLKKLEYKATGSREVCSSTTNFLENDNQNGRNKSNKAINTRDFFQSGRKGIEGPIKNRNFKIADVHKVLERTHIFRARLANIVKPWGVCVCYYNRMFAENCGDIETVAIETK